jgi:Zn-dependent peptidase ImmA (M78 family)/ribosome-binding protein aMBF1 (putative translation factor)
MSNKRRLSIGDRQDEFEHPHMPREQRPSTPPQTDEQLQLSPRAIAKWRRLTPHARDFLAQTSGREPLATNLRKARENRGLSQAFVAKKLRLSRSLVAQIELANRPVTADELEKFAHLYATTAVELTGTQVGTDDPVIITLLNLAPALIKDSGMQSGIYAVLGELMTLSHLERLLERPTRTGQPTYPLLSPRTLADAIRQGEEIAEHERQRLSLRDAPLPEFANLCAAQGVPVFALKLPDELSALFIAHESVGRAIVVNLAHHAVDQRLAIAHGYAHAVCEPMGTIRVCTRANANELIERRAAAFATAFLLPASVVVDTVRGLGKGQPSRQVQWIFDAATERSVRAEERSTPGSQVITYLDVAWIARRFGTAYRLTVSRLLGQGLISDVDRMRLVKPKLVELASEWVTLFSSRGASPHPASHVVVLSDLNAERAYMAIEACRRGLITKTELAQEALTLELQVPGLSQTKLLEFAEAAR